MAGSPDEVILRYGNVAVTKTRFIVGDQVFPIAGITSVRVAETSRGGGGALALGTILLLACLVTGISEEIWRIAVAVCLLVGSIGLFRLSITSRRKLYSVAIRTSAGEQSVCWSGDRDLVWMVAVSLNQAVIARG